MFRRVTLPNIRWGLLYGVILLQGARHRRVRRRIRRLRAHPRPDQHHAAARRDSLQRVQVFGGVRGRLGAGAARTRHADRARASSNGGSNVERRRAGGGSQRMSIEVRDITKRFGAFTARRRRVAATWRKASWSALLGPSGSGKTTLLRIIAGLERPIRLGLARWRRCQPRRPSHAAASDSSSSTTRCFVI